MAEDGWQELGDEAEQMEWSIVVKVGFGLTSYVALARAACRREVQTSTSRKPSDAVRWGTTVPAAEISRSSRKRSSCH